MIDNEYIDKFKKTFFFELIKKSFEKKNADIMFQGQGQYSMSSLPIIEPTDPSMVMIALHILLIDKTISNEVINNSFDRIEITEKNVCLILDYVRSYLLYREIDNIVIFQYEKLLDRIVEKEDMYNEKTCFKNLLHKINDLIKKRN